MRKTGKDEATGASLIKAIVFFLREDALNIGSITESSLVSFLTWCVATSEHIHLPDLWRRCGIRGSKAHQVTDYNAFK